MGAQQGNTATISVDEVIATSGTITITSFAYEGRRQRIIGEYQATFPDGSERSGAFDATQCR